MESNKYNYCKLNEITKPGSEYNFYGVVIDVSFPCKEPTPGTYACIVKLIDQSLNFVDNENLTDLDVITLVIKSNDPEKLPFIHEPGDIMRVHRGFYKPRGVSTVYLNIAKSAIIQSSWTLFPLYKDDYQPINSSSSNFVFEKVDEQFIRNLRSFSINILQKPRGLVYPYQIKLSDRLEAISSFDILVEVIKAKESDGEMTLLVADASEQCELHLDKYFSFIQQGDIIRVRNIDLFNKNTLIMRDGTNLMVMGDCYLAKQFNRNKQVGKEIKLRGFNSLILVEQENIVARTLETELPLREYGMLKSTDKRVNMYLKVIDIGVEKIENISTTLTEGGVKKSVFNTTLLCEESPFSKEIVKVIVSTYDNEGVSLFYPAKPMDFAKNAKELNNMKAVVKKLLQKGKYILATVEVIREKNQNLLRIVGAYSTN